MGVSLVSQDGGWSWQYIELSSGIRVCRVKSNDFKAEKVVSVCNAGGNLNRLNASGRDLSDVRIVDVPGFGNRKGFDHTKASTAHWPVRSGFSPRRENSQREPLETH